MQNPQGAFVWYELMTTKPEAAEAFYRGVVGWGAHDAGMPGMRYTILTAGETSVGGVMAIPEQSPDARPGWLGYVWADDVDALAAQVTETGGTIHRAPSDVPGVGRFAVAADPHGAVFVLFKGMPTGQQPQPPAPGTPGHAGWRELYAGDLDSAFAFYSKLFGWTKGDVFPMGPMGDYQLFLKDGEMIGGMMNKPPTVPAPYWGYYFTVEAIDAAAERVRAGGGQVVHGPSEVPGGSWIVQAMDPQGAFFALTAAKR